MGVVIWFTGLSGSGKSTIALELKKRVESLGKKADMIDGDVIRETLHKHLGFSREDIRENNRLIAELCAKRKAKFDFIFVPIISPYREDREMAKGILKDDFIELYVNASLKKCIERDVKGHYKKAAAGEIDNFIGISKSNPYEPPTEPDIEINTDDESVDESVGQVVRFLRKKALLDG